MDIASLRIVRELNGECVCVCVSLKEIINHFWECCAGPVAQRNVSSVESPLVSVRQLASSASSQLRGSSSLGESVFSSPLNAVLVYVQ